MWPFDDQEVLLWTPAAPAPEEMRVVALWWLHDIESRRFDLAYGWTFNDPASIRDHSVEVERCPNVADRELYRVTVRAQWDRAAVFCARFVEGASVGALCRELSIPLSPVGSTGALLHEMSLGSDPEGVARKYVRMPWVFRESSQVLATRAVTMMGVPSPVLDAPAVVRAVVSRDPLASLVSGPSADAARALMAALHRETGIAFAGPEAIRIGAFEAMFFPALTRERGALSVSASGGSVLVRLVAPARARAVAVRCRQDVRGEIVADELREIAVSQPVLELEFASISGGPFATEVSCWVTAEDTSGGAPRVFRIFASGRYNWIRDVRLRVGLAGWSEPRGHDWVREYALARATGHTLLDASLTDVRGALERDVRVGPDRQDFELAYEAREPLMGLARQGHSRTFHPEPSHAFASWLSERCKRIQADRVALVDSLFDEEGIRVLSQSCGDLNLAIVTSLRGRARGRALRRRIVSEIKRLDVRRRDTIQVLSVEPQSRSRGDALSARVLLIFDATRVVEAWLLSNSPAGSASGRLIVAAIDGQALSEVCDYFASLFVSNDTDHDGQVDVVWPQPSRPRERAAGRRPSAKVRLDVAVVRAGLLRTERFDTAWRRMAERLANATNAREVCVALSSDDAVVQRLVSYLQASLLRPPTRGGVRDGETDVGDTAKFVLQLTDRTCSTPALLRGTRAFLSHGLRARSRGPWSLYFGSRIIARHVAAVAAVLNTAAERQDDQGVVVRAVLVPQLLNELSDVLRADDLRGNDRDGVANELLASPVPILRALGVHSAIGRGQPSDLLQLSEERERLLALAYAMYEVRIRANRAESHKAARADGDTQGDVAQVQRDVFELMVGCWPVHAHADLLREVVELASGPLAGSWCISTNNDLLARLVEKGRLDAATVEGVWLGIFTEHVTPRSDYQFYAPVDVDLTQLVAWYVAQHGTGDAGGRRLGALDTALRQAVDGLARPFLRSTDYEAWRRLHDRAVWLITFARCVRLQGPERRHATDAWIGEWDRIQWSAEDALELDPTGLQRFAQAVLEASSGL